MYILTPSRRHEVMLKCRYELTFRELPDERSKSGFPRRNEAWESGALGNDPEFAKSLRGRYSVTRSTMRLPCSRSPSDCRSRSLRAFKLLAQVHGLGYQPLMRRALTRFAEAEMKLVLNDVHRRAAACRRGYGERRRDAAGRRPADTSRPGHAGPDAPGRKCRYCWICDLAGDVTSVLMNVVLSADPARTRLPLTPRSAP